MPVDIYPLLRSYSTSGWVLDIGDFKKWNPPQISSLFYSPQLCLLEFLVSLSLSPDFKGLSSISLPSFRAQQRLIFSVLNYSLLLLTRNDRDVSGGKKASWGVTTKRPSIASLSEKNAAVKDFIFFKESKNSPHKSAQTQP